MGTMQILTLKSHQGLTNVPSKSSNLRENLQGLLYFLGELVKHWTSSFKRYRTVKYLMQSLEGS
jgi:hypothetical protein